MIQVSYPGKLFLMGEYAAMQTGQTSIIASVNRYLTVTLTSQDHWEVNSRFGHVFYEDVFSMAVMPEVSAVLKTLSEYLERPLKPAHIDITSELDDGDKKYGFGSSGVVIVALVDALLKHESISVSKLEHFKLCVLVQKSIANYSSGGDLASSIFKGVIRYTRYDLNWLQAQTKSLKEISMIDWPALKIESLDLDAVARIAIGWTQTSNKTENYTQAVAMQAKKDPMTYRAFLVSAERFVSDFISGVESNDMEPIAQSMKMYRGLMNELGKWAHIEIETPELKKLIETSLALGYPAKISGSGGGDCGFALIKNHPIDALKEAWQAANILLIEE